MFIVDLFWALERLAAAVDVLALMTALVPPRAGSSSAFRIENAIAIVDVASDPKEREVLARIGAFESGYNEKVARCEVVGGGGSKGTFQIVPMTKRDESLACGSPREQAEVAARYVRRSAEACPGAEGAEKLCVYVSGRCGRGIEQARLRWGSP